MSKKVINKDMFNISQRIKKIDKNYFIVYNYLNNKWEVHNSEQLFTSYCLTCPYSRLDSRLLDYVYYTSTQHNSALLESVEKNNKDIEDKLKASKEDFIKTNLKNIYSYAENSTKSLELEKTIKNKWL